MTDYTDLDDFTRGYIECALWAESAYKDGDNDDRSFQDIGLDESDIEPDSMKQIMSVCADFQQANAANLAQYYDRYHSSHGYTSMACAGHDFWLTRQGHGAGFWDRGLGELGDRLSKASKAYGKAYFHLSESKETIYYE